MTDTTTTTYADVNQRTSHHVPKGKLPMSKLTAKDRNALSDSTFAGPGRSYPVPDKSHAANAKARASAAVNAGRMSKRQEASIDAKANRVLGKGRKTRGLLNGAPK